MTPAEVEADLKNAPPMRIWLQTAGDFDACSILDQVTWCQHPIDDGDDEYIRADLHTARIAALEAGLRQCAAEIAVPIPATDAGEIDWQQLYEAWRKIACDRADIARALLGEKP